MGLHIRGGKIWPEFVKPCSLRKHHSIFVTPILILKFGCLILLSLLPAILITVPPVVQRRRFTGSKSRRCAPVVLILLQFIFLTLAAWCGAGVIARMASAFMLAFYSLLTALDFIFFRIMGQPLGFDTISLGFRERRYVKNMSHGFVGWADFGFAGLLIAGALLPALFMPGMGWLPWICGLAGLCALALLGAAAPCPSAVVNALGRVLWDVMRAPASNTRDAGPDRRRNAFPLRSPTRSSRLNVLAIVNESLSRSLLHGPGVEATPELHSFLRDNGGVFQFPLALSNTTASDVSYPSLFSGLPPTQSRERFESNPLIWSAARVGGYHTSFYTAWDLGWAGLGKLIVDENVDLIVDPKILLQTLVNDNGINDIDLNLHAARCLQRVAEPFFSVVAYNSQHIPCLIDETVGRFNLGTLHGRYLNSLTVLDSCFKTLVDALRTTGRLERTIIFFLSDHGENPSYFDVPGADASAHSPRVDDFTHDLLSVPFWIYLPPGAMEPARVDALRKNQSRIVSNLDYYPTALSAMGLDLNDDEREHLELGGNDLFRPLPGERDIPCFNTGALRKWRMSPAALASGCELLIYHDISETFELLDLSRAGGRDLWPSASTQEKELWMDRMTRAGLWPALPHSS